MWVVSLETLNKALEFHLEDEILDRTQRSIQWPKMGFNSTL